MNLMVVGGYICVDATNLRGGYQKSFIVIAQIPNHRNGHYVRPNKVVFKYPNFKEDDDPDAHVKVFNYVIKENSKTFKKYIINVFSYTLRNTTSD
jgi:hypothetical protein